MCGGDLVSAVGAPATWLCALPASGEPPAVMLKKQRGHPPSNSSLGLASPSGAQAASEGAQGEQTQPALRKS